jgi:hypothetical protein
MGILSTVSKVVKRLAQERHSRRRRMLAPSSAGRESTTLLSLNPQKGHFIGSFSFSSDALARRKILWGYFNMFFPK